MKIIELNLIVRQELIYGHNGNEVQIICSLWHRLTLCSAVSLRRKANLVIHLFIPIHSYYFICNKTFYVNRDDDADDDDGASYYFSWVSTIISCHWPSGLYFNYELFSHISSVDEINILKPPIDLNEYSCSTTHWNEKINFVFVCIHGGDFRHFR